MNYGELKAAVVAYSHRTDTAALIPTFLALAEQRIYFGEINSERVRIGAMVKTASMVDGTLPTDFLEAQRFICPAFGIYSEDLVYTSLDRLDIACRSYGYQGQTVVLSSDASFPLTVTYWAKFGALASDSDTNWLLTNAPNVYLSSMLVELARWSRDDEMGAREAANYASAIDALQTADSATQHSGSPLRITANGTRAI